MEFNEAIEFLTSVEPGQRVSLLDPQAVNHPGKWCAKFALHGEHPTLPYTPACRNREHFRLYMRVWERTGYISNICACELAAGRKRLALWDMPDGAKHALSATGFTNREEDRTWQSTQCGVLLETTGGRALWREGHIYSPLYGDVPDTLTCPGCRIRNGMPPDICPGVVRLA